MILSAAVLLQKACCSAAGKHVGMRVSDSRPILPTASWTALGASKMYSQ